MAIRLINTETLRMKVFVGASVPPYAILSHNWVDGEEVDFQDMTRFGAVPPDAILQHFVEDSGGRHGEAPGNEAGVWKQLPRWRQSGDDAQELHRYADGEDEDINFEALALAVDAPKADGPVAGKRICSCSCHCDCCVAVVDPAAAEVRRRSGYKKIVRTCRLAKKHGIDWAWVDTCCIDKSSSAELSEAINSMFKWYKNSAVCYAFLSDLDPGAQNIKQALGECRWFTRGWTLQELIAPRRVFFFNGAWRVIGSKRTWQAALYSITGIVTEALCGDRDRLGTFSVATKITWASKRQTTRTEDMAYCILGIFNINMPLLYGEGEKAFLRLQHEILARVNDPSIFCTSSLDGCQSWTGSRDVFALSPAQFRTQCKKCVGSCRHWGSRTGFMMTSKGLLVQNPFLFPLNHPGLENPCYLLFLDYDDHLLRASLYIGAIVLSWVGPDRYVRVNVDGPVCDLDHLNTWIHHCRGRTVLREDFYIMTAGYFENAEYIHDKNEARDSCLVLMQVAPPYRPLVIRPSASREWDVAKAHFTGTGLAWAQVELLTDGENGYRMLARFHFAFFMDPYLDCLWVRLYASDQWKEGDPDFERHLRTEVGGPHDSWWSGIRMFGKTDWLCLGNDFEIYRGKEDAPVRVRGSIEFPGGYPDSNPTRYKGIRFEAQRLQKDGSYSECGSEGA